MVRRPDAIPIQNELPPEPVESERLQTPAILRECVMYESCSRRPALLIMDAKQAIGEGRASEALRELAEAVCEQETRPKHRLSPGPGRHGRTVASHEILEHTKVLTDLDAYDARQL
jgi:hypothetical protein